MRTLPSCPTRLQHSCESQPLRIAAPQDSPQTHRPSLLQALENPGPHTWKWIHFLVNNTVVYKWSKNINKMDTQSFLHVHWIPTKIPSLCYYFCLHVRDEDSKPQVCGIPTCPSHHLTHISRLKKCRDALRILLLLLMLPLSTHNSSILAGIWELNVWTNIIYQ